jgi:hypothetical protein
VRRVVVTAIAATLALALAGCPPDQVLPNLVRHPRNSPAAIALHGARSSTPAAPSPSSD